MIDATRLFVRSAAINSGALGHCLHCRDHHLATRDDLVIASTIAAVEEAKATGDERLVRIVDVGSYVRHLLVGSPKLCEVMA